MAGPEARGSVHNSSVMTVGVANVDRHKGGLNAV